MPWKIFGSCIHKLNADGSKGEQVEGSCHDDISMTRKMLAALYANEEKMTKKKSHKKVVMIEPLEEEEIEEATPEEIKPEEKPVEPEKEEPKEEEKSLLEKIEGYIPYFDKLKEFFTPKEKPQPKDFKSSLTLVKDVQGRYHALGMVTNKWRDRDKFANPENGGEILTEAAHKEYMAFLDKNPQFAPHLVAWHEKKTASKASAEWWAYNDGFVFMAWPLEEEEAKGIQKAEETFGPLGMSHEFVTNSKDQKKGLIHKYRMTEGTHLPVKFAANLFTDFAVARTEVKNMAKFSEDKRKYLTEIFGEEKTVALEKDSEERAKALTEAGVQSKDYEAPDPMLKAFESIAEILTQSKKDSEKVTEAVKALTDRVGAVEKSTDQKVAEIIKPKLSEVMSAKTGEEGEKITEEKAKELAPKGSDGTLSWFKNSFDAIDKKS